MSGIAPGSVVLRVLFLFCSLASERAAARKSQCSELLRDCVTNESCEWVRRRCPKAETDVNVSNKKLGSYQTVRVCKVRDVSRCSEKFDVQFISPRVHELIFPLPHLKARANNALQMERECT